MDKKNIVAYFDRIGLVYKDDYKCDGELLSALQYAHVTSVPYETTDIVDGKSLSLEEDDLFRKVVTEHRGGYCFELNGIFGFLLRSLGYQVDEYMARFLRGESEPPKPRHRVLIVTAGDKKYLCDVGVGSKAPRYPLLLEQGIVQEQCGESYRIESDDFLGTVVMEKTGDGWTRYFSFNDNKQLNKDYYTPSFYCEKHPDSPFLCNMLSLKTDSGRYTVDKDTFRVWEGEEIVAEMKVTGFELEQICLEYFGMTLHR